MAKAAVLTLVFAAATVGLVVLGIRGATRVSCEACVTFNGRTECRISAGRTEEEATRTAVDHACAFLAAGMTESVACTTRSPVRSRCDLAPPGSRP
jgi:hypothetical protein